MGPSRKALAPINITTKDGQRMSAARAFLRPAMKRRNLRVVTHAQVTRVLFEGTRATGVEYLHGRCSETGDGGARGDPGGRRHQFAAAPAALRHRAGESCCKRTALRCGWTMPMSGAHLQDHVGINYTYRMKVPTLNDELRPWWGKLRVGLHYILSRGGPLSLSVNQGGGFFRTSPDHTRPNMQLYMQAFSTLIPKAGERPLLTPDPFSGFSLGLSNCRPTSRGFIEIQSADPLQHPRIVANAYSTDAGCGRDAGGGEIPAQDRGAGTAWRR